MMDDFTRRAASLRGVKTLLLSITAAAAGPTVVAGGVAAYAQSTLSNPISYEYVVAGVILVFLLSVFILRHEARRIFALIDSIPPLAVDVAEIKDDLKEVRGDIGKLVSVVEEYPDADRVEKHLKMGHDHGTILTTHELRLGRIEAEQKDFGSRLRDLEREKRG